MCFFDHTTWTCGAWKWSRFREQCCREHRIGYTCGLKLVFSTDRQPQVCTICRQVLIKNRRIAKLVADIYRWERDGGKPASVAKAKDEVVQIRIELARLHTSHVSKELVPRISSFRSSFRNHKKITTFV